MPQSPRPPDLDADGRPVTASPARPPDLDAEGRPVSAEPPITDRGLLAQLAQLEQWVQQTRNDVGLGMLKGAGRTMVGLGQLTHQIPGVSRLVDALYGLAGMPMDSSAVMGRGEQVKSDLGLDAEGNAQQLGMLLEQMGEFMIPAAASETTAATIAGKIAPRVQTAFRGAARLAPRMATQGATSGLLTAAQGGDARVGAAVGAAAPVVGAIASRGAQAIKNRAVPLVRSALKPTVTEMKRQAGASVVGIDAHANRLAKFIVDHRLTNPDKAEAVIVGAERELQTLLAGAKGATDAPQRAARYLQALERSAAKQGLGAGDVAVIRGKAVELLKSSPLSEDVIRLVRKPSPTGVVTASGKPVMVQVPETTRALRSDVSPSEALEIARSTSRWSTRKAYGELKGAAMEADKAVERAARDAVKAAVPAAKPILQTQGQAITAKKVLQRQAFREANRDQISLPAHVIAAGEIASGRVPILAAAANWLRNHQLKAGIWADQLATALQRKDARTVSRIMTQIAAGGVVQTTKPAQGSR